MFFRSMNPPSKDARTANLTRSARDCKQSYPGGAVRREIRYDRGEMKRDE